tara:strand:+ start:6803 stop:7288 length:486 start_codon:yes stop_codon:yes gene_type:complete
MLSTVKQFLDILTNDKIIIGICIIFLNIASRYIDLKLTKNQELIVKKLGKEVLIFFIAFIGTRDILVSIILTIIYWILINLLLHEDSNFCILPDNLKKLHTIIDTNNDDKISKEELDNAYSILKKANNNHINNDMNNDTDNTVDNSKYNFYNNFNGLGIYN